MLEQQPSGSQGRAIRHHVRGFTVANYCVNKNRQPNGDHEVHNLDTNCVYLPTARNQLHLGSHTTCQSAVTEAKRTYPNSDGCFYCARACHTG